MFALFSSFYRSSSLFALFMYRSYVHNFFTSKSSKMSICLVCEIGKNRKKKQKVVVANSKNKPALTNLIYRSFPNQFNRGCPGLPLVKNRYPLFCRPRAHIVIYSFIICRGQLFKLNKSTLVKVFSK